MKQTHEELMAECEELIELISLKLGMTTKELSKMSGEEIQKVLDIYVA